MKYLLLFLVCFNLNAQLNIRGTEYTLLDDMGIPNITVARNEATRFPELNWTEINNGNLDSFVKAFVRDAVVNRAELDLSDNRRILEFRPPTFWSDPRIGGSSYGSIAPGYDILINRDVWDRVFPMLYPDRVGIAQVQLIYHELGHALLHAGHVCDVWVGSTSHYAVMATGTCAGENGGPGYRFQEDHGYNLSRIEGWIQHLFDFEDVYELSRSQATRKGPDVIND